MNLAKLATAAAALALVPFAAQAQDAATAPAAGAATPSDTAAPAETATPAAGAAAPAAGAATPSTGAVQITQGATVTGNDGNPIGTVMQVTPQAVVVDTGMNQIPLPRDAFAQGDTGLTLNITKTELDTSYSQQMAALEAQVSEKLVAGTPVMTADSQPLGTVDTVQGENVVLAMTGDEKLTLGKDVFAVDSNGSLMVRATKAQIDQAMAGSAAPAQS